MCARSAARPAGTAAASGSEANGKEREKCRSYYPKTEQKRLDKKIMEYSQWVKENRATLTTNELWDATNAKLRGHYNAYGVYCNRPRLYTYFYSVISQLFRWLNRRSQKTSYTWDAFKMRMQQFPLLAPPAVNRLKPLIDRKMYA